MSRTVLWLMAAGAVVIAAAVGGVWHGKLSELTTLGQAAKPTAAASSAPVPSPAGLGSGAADRSARGGGPQLRRCQDRAGRRRRDRRARPAGRQDRPARWRQGDCPGPRRCKRRMGHHRTGSAAQRGPARIARDPARRRPCASDLRPGRRRHRAGPDEARDTCQRRGRDAGHDRAVVRCAHARATAFRSRPAEIRRPRDVDAAITTKVATSRSRDRRRPARWCGPTSTTRWSPRATRAPTEAGGSRRPIPSAPASTSSGSTGSPRTASRLPVSNCRLTASRSRRGRATASRVVIVRGDSLWNIARAHYGTGFQHTLIYGANKDQIRNPDLIYPGQVFSLPKGN